MPDGRQPIFNPTDPYALDGSDEAMLIDPCSDDPSEHFEWEREMLVCKTERGVKTREVCGLDRTDLEQERRKQIQKIDDVLFSLRIAQLIPDSEEMRYCKWRLRQLLGDEPHVPKDHPEAFTAMARAYLADQLPTISDDLVAEFAL
ncbi:MAG: hypothetical protein QM758_28330 [Armatimonas sp.]